LQKPSDATAKLDGLLACPPPGSHGRRHGRPPRQL